jgi:hypothetical protein
MARKYVLVDCCPVPEKLAPAVREVKAATGLRLNSCYRASDAEHLLRQCGKLSQAQLYYRFINGWPGYNPANPPGRSTHECRNDGVAYAGWVGMPLRWWQVGMDWSYGAGAVAAFNRKGYSAALTYPNNSRELHHVNLRKKPFVSIWKIRPLKRGMRSDRVKRVKWMLHVIRDENEKRYLICLKAAMESASMRIWRGLLSVSSETMTRRSMGLWGSKPSISLTQASATGVERAE